MVFSNGKYAVIDLPKGKIDVKDWMDLSNMKVMVDLKAEWNQIYHEAWRQMRYFLYAPNMKESIGLPSRKNMNPLYLMLTTGMT